MKRAYLEVDLEAMEKIRKLNDKLDEIIYGPDDVRGGTLTGLHIELDRFLKDAGNAVQITRCINCKYRTSEGFCSHPRLSVLPSVSPQDFCSYGIQQ